MNKVIGLLLVLLIGVTGYLATANNKMSEENAKLTKKLIEKEQDYSWLERELQVTKRELDKMIREKTNLAKASGNGEAQTSGRVSNSLSKKNTQTQKVQAKHKNAQQLLENERVTANGKRL